MSSPGPGEHYKANDDGVPVDRDWLVVVGYYVRDEEDRLDCEAQIRSSAEAGNGDLVEFNSQAPARKCCYAFPSLEAAIQFRSELLARRDMGFVNARIRER